jgi:hypothetical protein
LTKHEILVEAFAAGTLNRPSANYLTQGLTSAEIQLRPPGFAAAAKDG